MSMSSELPSWNMIADLQPKLHTHIQIYPQSYRHQRWYILRDSCSGQHLRISARAYGFVGRLDGSVSVEQAWVGANAVEHNSLEQDEVFYLLIQLIAQTIVKVELPESSQEYFNRLRYRQNLSRFKGLLNPLAIRIPLLDPGQLLESLHRWLSPLMSRLGIFLWGIVIVAATLMVVSFGEDLTLAIQGDIFAFQNLFLMLPVFVVMKLVHEFSHALVVKHWGGEVHEMGISLLVLMPVPYVDTSAAWGFRNRYKRMLVGAAGIMAEMFFAAIALFIWLLVEPGIIQNLALNAFLIGTVSTFLFNANPLLRFDGYYILQDLIEIPNLSSRSGRYNLYLLQRYLFGLKQAQSPVTAAGEEFWFLLYGCTAFVYRLLILVIIVLFLIDEYMIVGLILAVWAVLTQVLLPLLRGTQYLLIGQALKGGRCRALSSLFLLGGGLAALVLFYPITYTSSAEGVVWVSDQARLYAASKGVVSTMLTTPGSQVEAGQPLIRLEAFGLDNRINKLKARRYELETRRAAEQFEQHLKSQLTAEEIEVVEAELTDLREQQASLLIRSQVAGTFVLADSGRIRGRYLQQGELIGYVLSRENLIVRAVIPQSEIGLIRIFDSEAQVRLAERLDQTATAEVIRKLPGGGTQLPSRALGRSGGGEIAVVADGEGLVAMDEIFQIDLRLPEDFNVTGIGERAYVRFNHGDEPLAWQWMQKLRQLILSRL
ncbi:hypothetical protein [Amphritea balenae]|uniref:Peptidase M50 n=1 Tax=Amphritea balenae TaxID=452629 RepID=A0A3P1SNE4_9GAMM|nr:hypothetical protein [Amphritea balenae]RRC98175.1 hypothetical protein EHS89_13830 [Amphritea balenae]